MQLSNAFNFYFLLKHAQNSFLWIGTFFPEIKIKFRLWDGCVLPPKSKGPSWDPHKCNPNTLGKRKMIQDTIDHTHAMWPVTFKLQAYVVSCSDMSRKYSFRILKLPIKKLAEITVDPRCINSSEPKSFNSFQFILFCLKTIFPFIWLTQSLSI